jgi:hypothetical protein
MQAARIRELELLHASEDELPTAESLKAGIGGVTRAGPPGNDRLRELHGRMQDDLRGNLAWVRELVTLIHLAKYTGAPASRAEELVAQIAAAVEGLSEVSDWRTSDVAVTAAG